ncbi:MAG: CBS domain-containing protein [Bdellovibrionia bacterium]
MLKNIISNKLVSCEPGTNLLEVSKLMARENVGCVLVLQDNKPKGLVTDRDIVIQCVADGHVSENCMVDDVMSTDLQTVMDTDGIFDCIQAMKTSEVRRLPVVDSDGNAVGIVSFGDLLSMLSRELSELTSTTTPSDIEIEERRAA